MFIPALTVATVLIVSLVIRVLLISLRKSACEELRLSISLKPRLTCIA